MNKFQDIKDENLQQQQQEYNLSVVQCESTLKDAKISVNERIEFHIREVLKLISITNEEVLEVTPRRFREVLQDRTASNREALDPKILKTFEIENPGIVMVKDIEVNSMCEHHLLPFFGTVSLAYLPKTHVLGLSKLVRIVDYCSKKENLQERLTQQILKTLGDAVENDGVCIIIKCKHCCMIMNDEIRSKSDTITIAKSGKFRDDPKILEEFLNSMK